MEYKNVLQLYKSQCNKLKELLSDSSLLGVDEWSFLLEGFYEIEELLSDPILSEPIDNLQIEVKSKIDQYGVGSFIVNLYQEGYPIDSIVEQLKLRDVPLTTTDVSKWLDKQSQRSILDRAQSKYGNVFDTADQLQRTLNRLEELSIRVENEENLSNFKKNSKYEVALAVIAEVRKTIKDGYEFAKSIQSMQKIERFQSYVLEEIKKESPDCYQRIINRLTNLTTVFNNMDLKGF